MLLITSMVFAGEFKVFPGATINKEENLLKTALQ